MCVKGIPSSFLRHTTIKLFKGSDYECIILAISMMDIFGQKEILRTQQSNIMIWYNWYWRHDVWTLGSA